MTANGKPSNLINRAEVRRKLIEHATDTRYYWRTVKPRVSEARLDEIEGLVSAAIRRIVEKLPSSGKTI